MSRPFSELKVKMLPAAQADARALTEQLIKAMPLQELRTARAQTQKELARALGIKQAAVSRLERRGDMYVSTLQRTIQAMGGVLDIIARFPDGMVALQIMKPDGIVKLKDMVAPKRRPAKGGDMPKKTVTFSRTGASKLPKDKPVVYRIQTATGKTNYVGVAQRGRVQERIQEHLSTGKIPGAKVQIEQKSSIREARKTEARVIARANPKYNRQG